MSQTQNNILESLRLVLMAPKFAGNVGACARAATNFDVSDVAVVAPQCDIQSREAKLYGKSAARETLAQIKNYHQLNQALSDCSAVVAFTRRYGEWSPPEIEFNDLSTWLLQQNSKHKTAFVFGREDNCLEHAELLLCTHYCTIPTSFKMPTLNLSHSVAVVLARVFSDLQSDGLIPKQSLWHGTNKKPEYSEPLTQCKMDEMSSFFQTGLFPSKINGHSYSFG